MATSGIGKPAWARLRPTSKLSTNDAQRLIAFYIAGFRHSLYSKTLPLAVSDESAPSAPEN